MRLAGAAAIVTGGGRGIGRAIAAACAREGASVVVAARTRDEVEAVRDEIAAAGGRALAVVADVRQAGDVEAMVDAARRAFGQIDILVNNAGVPGPTGMVHEISEDEWDATLDINLKGMFLCCRSVVPLMIAQRKGNIINVSSGAGIKQPREMVRSLPYQVSKFGVEGLTDVLAIQLRPFGINVNSLLPGPIAIPPGYEDGHVGNA